MKKQRILSLVFALVLLLGTATACGKKKEEAKKPTESGIATLAAAKAAIEAGDYEDAYRYLITDESAEATELLSKFAFVPVEYTREKDGEADSKTVYTYDENGNLLSVNDDFTYTYDDQGRMVLANLYKVDKVILSYDETGCTITRGSDWVRIEDDLLASYPGSHESATAENGWCDKGVYHIIYNEKGQILGYKLVCTVCDVEETDYSYTYDEQGRLLTDDAGINGKDIYTYDEQGRLLTKYNGGYGGTWIKDSYTYDENGNKIKWEYEDYSWDYSNLQEDADPEYILTTGCSVYTYDEKGNLIKAEGTGDWQDQYWFTDEGFGITSHGDLSEYTLNITYDGQGRITEREFDSIDKYSDGREYRTYRKETYTYDSDGTCTILCTDENNVTLGKRINYADGSNEQWCKNADDSELSLKRYEKFDEFGNRIENGNDSAKGTDTYQLVYYPEGIPTLYMREDVMPLAVRYLWRINISMPEFARRAVNFTREEWFRYAHLCEVLGIKIPS